MVSEYYYVNLNNLIKQILFSCLGWTGELCETDIDECVVSPCENGGLCINVPSTYTCACLFGFTGKNCDKKIVPCDSNPCKNNAVCLLEDDQTVCYCVPDYHGELCEQKYDDCEAKFAICDNGGTCVDGVNNFTCSCPVNYYGQTCTQYEPTMTEIPHQSSVASSTMAVVIPFQTTPSFVYTTRSDTTLDAKDTSATKLGSYTPIDTTSPLSSMETATPPNMMKSSRENTSFALTTAKPFYHQTVTTDESESSFTKFLINDTDVFPIDEQTLTTSSSIEMKQNIVTTEETSVSFSSSPRSQANVTMIPVTRLMDRLTSLTPDGVETTASDLPSSISSTETYTLSTERFSDQNSTTGVSTSSDRQPMNYNCTQEPCACANASIEVSDCD